MLVFLLGESDVDGPGQGHARVASRGQIGGPKIPSAPPCYTDVGWLQWPDDEAYPFQFMRMLGAAQEGAGTIPECFFRGCRTQFDISTLRLAQGAARSDKWLPLPTSPRWFIKSIGELLWRSLF